MYTITHGTVPVGHKDNRRTIFDVLTEGNAGGGRALYNLAYFDPLRPGNSIGNHFHCETWETYIILSGDSVMSLQNVETGESRVITITEDLLPYHVTIPPKVAHRLDAKSQTTLLIATTGNTNLDTIPHTL